MFFVPSPEVLVCLSSLIKPKAQQKTDLFYNKYMYKKQYKIGSYDKKSMHSNSQGSCTYCKLFS